MLDELNFVELDYHITACGKCLNDAFQSSWTPQFLFQITKVSCCGISAFYRTSLPVCPVYSTT